MDHPAPPLSDRPVGGPDSTFVMVEWQDEGNSSAERPIAPLHIHNGGEEAWYVLEGVLGVRVGEQVHAVGPGAAVLAPRGAPHTFWNAGEGRCRYIIVMSPEIHELIQSLHDVDSDLAQLFAKYGSELL